MELIKKERGRRRRRGEKGEQRAEMKEDDKEERRRRVTRENRARKEWLYLSYFGNEPDTSTRFQHALMLCQNIRNLPTDSSSKLLMYNKSHSDTCSCGETLQETEDR